MNILTISGSSRPDSSNVRLLENLGKLDSHCVLTRSVIINELPLFMVELDKNPLPEAVIQWKSELHCCDGLIISTPEYLHNFPALIKNALEWIASSGELVGKPVLAITYTPNSPRGEKAMQSLLWTLGALDSKILTNIETNKKSLTLTKDGQWEGEDVELLQEAIKLFYT